MTMKKVRLGRGLNALGLNAEIDKKQDSNKPITELNIEQLTKGKYQPRLRMNQEALEGLASSIKKEGIIAPVVVRYLSNNNYEIIAGERRWKASKIAGLKKIPVIVKNVNDESALALSLIENIQREDLNAIEEARALQRLVEEFALTHQKIADYVGKKRATISNLLRLLTLHKDVQELIEDGKIEMGHARALLTLNQNKQAEIAKQIIERNLTVRQTESLVRLIENPISRKKSKNTESSDKIKKLQSQLKYSLKNKALIRPITDDTGKIILTYKSLEELNSIVDSICK